MLVEQYGEISGYKSKVSFKPKAYYKPKVVHTKGHHLGVTQKVLHKIGEKVAQYRHQHLFSPIAGFMHNIGQTVEHKVAKKVNPIEYIKTQPWIRKISIFDFSKGEKIKVHIVGNWAHLSMWIPKELALKYLSDYISLRKPNVIFVDGFRRHEQLERTNEGYIIRAQPMYRYYPVI